MANPELLEEQREETRLIIEELLEDGSDPDALYTIEHHFSADDFEALENMAVAACKRGSDVTEPDALAVGAGADGIDVQYAGWGTYFDDPNGEDGEEGDDEDYVDEDDDGVRH